MYLVSAELQKQMKDNEFVWNALTAVRDLIYVEHRDWDSISRESEDVAFDNEYAKLSWYALCEIIGNKDRPQSGTVSVGGVRMTIECIHEIEKTLQQ